jgi:uncharacterized membrane protein YkoI
MHLPRLTLLAFFLAASALAGPAPAHADGFERDQDEQEETALRDHIRDLVQQGKLLPLRTLKAQVLDKWPGDLIDVTVNRKNDVILYEFRILRAGGQVTEVEIDAASGRVIEVENE